MFQIMKRSLSENKMYLPYKFLVFILLLHAVHATQIQYTPLKFGFGINQARKSNGSSSWASRGGAKRRGGASAVAATGVRTMSVGKMKTLNLLSGGIAGTIASCITNPLEVIKTQLQSSSASKINVGDFAGASGHPISIANRILKSEGIPGFFCGLRPTLVGIIPARSLYFYSYEQSKRSLGKLLLPEGSVMNALLSGFAAGVASNTITNPIWMVKTRYQLLADKSAGQKAYNGYNDAIATIYREEGIGGFYKGLFASYWGCAEGALQFILYEQIKTRMLCQKNADLKENRLPPTDKLPKHIIFIAAAVAKCTAAVATYPHEVARTRIREQARGGIFKYRSMWQTIGIVAKEEGRSGLYAGMGVHLLKVVPNSAIMFLTYEVVNTWLSQFKVIE